jgi:LuxR family maltose regulon positive regulatory protein
VLRLLARGKKNSEISQLMGITLRTVKFHTANIYSKLCVQNRAQAMKAAEKLGL